MKVYHLNSFEHISGGRTAKKYDGPLTQKSRKEANSLIIPLTQLIYCGKMRRHTETAQAVCTIGAHIDAVFGDDQTMFDVITNNNQAPVDAFWNEIQAIKTSRCESVMIISSIAYTLITSYALSGGLAVWGPFGDYYQFIKNSVRKGGIDLPIWQNGVVIPFDV